MYILLSGSVNILVESSNDTTSLSDLQSLSQNAKNWVPTSEELESREYVVAGLGPGDSFGELGLERADSRRTASVIAVEDCTMMCIAAKHYRAAKANMLHERLDDVVEVLRRVAPISHFSQPRLVELAEKCNLSSFAEEKVIVKQGKPCSTVYIVKEGVCRELQWVDVDGGGASTVARGKSGNRRKRVLLETSEIQPYDIFGMETIVRNMLDASAHVSDDHFKRHSWDERELVYEMNVAVKRGEVHAEVVSISLSNFIKHVMHDAKARGAILSVYREKQASVERAQQDLQEQETEKSDHMDILDLTSPKYIRRRQAAKDRNKLTRQKEWCTDVVHVRRGSTTLTESTDPPPPNQEVKTHV